MNIEVSDKWIAGWIEWLETKRSRELLTGVEGAFLDLLYFIRNSRKLD